MITILWQSQLSPTWPRGPGFLCSTKNVVARASEFTRNGVKSKDALHIACAIEGKAEYFLTTDDKLIKKLAETIELIVINPVNFIPILESM